MGMRTRAHTPPTVPASTRARSTSPAEGEAAHVSAFVFFSDLTEEFSPLSL